MSAPTIEPKTDPTQRERFLAWRGREWEKAAAAKKERPAHRLGVDVDAPIPPTTGDPVPGGGLAANVLSGVEWQGVTTQVCGLFPFAAPSGVHVRGVPVGTHQHTGEPVGLDPAQWLADKLVSNTAIWCQGQPGIGKSTIIKRLMIGLMSFGFRAIVQGDLKDEYEDIVLMCAGEDAVARVGRGLGVLNPLDTSPLIPAIAAATGQKKINLLGDAHASQVDLLEAMVTIGMRGAQLETYERTALELALRLASEGARRHDNRDPIIPQVLEVLTQGPAELRWRVAANPDVPYDYEKTILRLREGLRLTCEGALKGMFDGPSTFRVDPDLPAFSLSLSAVEDSSDDVIAAAMMCSWAWTSMMSRGQSAVGKPRNVFQIQDELWKGLRAAPGLVEKSDGVTRLGRHKGMVSAQVSHSQEDLDALPTPEDRAKARGLASRSNVQIFGGCDGKEVERIGKITKISEAEGSELKAWAAPPTWVPGLAHPGRGKYLIKSGQRQGLPITMRLSALERKLYDTDRAFSSVRNKRMA
ncbi:hypothetical protein [Rhodococcus sp. BH5]|uniref:hypothetical protein n=1 Tax=Rhodococcus sp. BH5 TaxID=2871702 RepID=UPI0022CD201A|nr:hypothetical protein [Rhodococcus sp. BH5]MCZ9635042.1 hypothetical protein [Rhodococcus sp. BH5]